MTNFIPIFPLGVVVYPGEQLNLHIFEPRYRQLIRECMDRSKPFGIPSVIDNKIMEFGTLVEVAVLKQEYEDGKMDIITRGIRVFRLLEVVQEIPDKLYSGAIVNYPENDAEAVVPAIRMVVAGVRELHRLLKVEKVFPRPDEQLRSYDLAHMAGLSLEEEYEMLQLLREDQRVEYLRRHLQKVLPVVREMEALKDRIKLNGHFRELKSLGFE
ncbi:MAG: LON peptidase substrate-binding domain-containing protein [Chitinophagaceae bacterium]|nr:LON peptidase substrate-binding domain-containing protein [Chitinophagaceae bacterium]